MAEVGIANLQCLSVGIGCNEIRRPSELCGGPISYEILPQLQLVSQSFYLVFRFLEVDFLKEELVLSSLHVRDKFVTSSCFSNVDFSITDLITSRAILVKSW